MQLDTGTHLNKTADSTDL